MRGDVFEINAKLTDGNIPSKKLLMNAAKGTQEITNGRPNAFNGIGVNFSNPIGISVCCPLALTVAHRVMTAVESQVALPLIGINGSLLLGELMDMFRKCLLVGLWHDPESHVTALSSHGANNRWSVIGIGAPSPTLVGTASGRV